MSSIGTLWRGVRLAVFSGTLVTLLAFTGQPAGVAAPADPGPVGNGTMNRAFARATSAYQVPRDLLTAVGYGETHLDDHEGKPSHAGGYGVMHLVSNPRRTTLELAAELTGEPAHALRTESAANIRGGAAVLRHYADELGLSAKDRRDVGKWYPVIARYSGAEDDRTARLYADTVYAILAQGVLAETDGGERVSVKRQHVTPALGRYAKVRPLDNSTGNATTQQQESTLSADYPPARWVPANSANYSNGRSSAITKVVVHVTQGSYAGTINWFQNPSAGVSAHYVVRSSDGQVTQMVRDGDTGFHARSANAYAVGIEHEGYVDNPSWFTDAMYRSSADLTRHLANRYGIPKTRAYIVGHNEVPGNDHTDPGPNWNWNYYMQLVNSGSRLMLGGSPADFSGDGKDDVVTFTHGSLADAYVATSTGSSFSGTSVKWNDFFGLNGETPLSGDVNGDGKDDVVTFTHGPNNDVYVGLSNGSSFGGGQKWNDFFSLSGEVPATGDFNGDGKDDIVTFTHNATADVHVGLSNGSSFSGGQKWHDFFAPAGEFPAVGDVNGDGKDDIITFTQGSSADVYVALSTGSSFAPSKKVHDFFAPGTEQPRVGDVNGDGRDDIVTFTSDANADVYVAFSDGARFTGGGKANDYFALPGEFPFVGDYNGDGKDDIVTFTHTASADVYVGLSNGSSFGGGQKWHDYFGLPGETTF
ncbi:N-acetylmuramoyl-L-alanine amidase [Streptomyces sp. NPDC060035]|uniref:N-acetylmuramoyl-L-alanine amidase n=1 Tax=Streptomyces sp. NPDC060035 TaxID=3347044 RepID=UPI0036B75C93